MRSMLFVPGDSEKKLDKGLSSGADALIVDLEDSVALANKAAARTTTAAFLRRAAELPARPLLYVRINAFDTGLADADLDAVLPARPDGIMLPKSASGRDVTQLDAKLTAREPSVGVLNRATRIVAIATETAAAVFNLGTYAGASDRLQGLTWGAEDLSADIGAEANRFADGAFRDPYRLARSLCVLGAAAAAVQSIDTVYTAFRNEEGLRRECEEARIEGFTGKMAIHPAQVAVINEVFTPSTAEIERAEKIVAAFAEAGDAGVIGLDGEMLDRPHLRRAERLLARAGFAKRG